MKQQKVTAPRSVVAIGLGVVAMWAQASCSRESGFKSKPSAPEGGQAGDGSISASSESDGGRSNTLPGRGGQPGIGSSNGDGNEKKDSADGEGAVADGFGTGAQDAAAVATLRSLPRNVNVLTIDKKELDATTLGCQVKFDLDAVSADNSIDTTSGVRWASSNRDIITISSTGEALVVGSGKVTLVAVGKKADGSEYQDSIEVVVPPALNGYRVSMVDDLKSLRPAEELIMAGVKTYKEGLARGRIRLAHPESTIAIKSVQSTMNSRDLKNFVFKEFAEPKLDTKTCTWFVEYTVEFNNLYVPVVTQYNEQVMTINFFERMVRQPFSFTWLAILVPEGFTGDTSKPVNVGTGAQGFSPVR